MTKLHKIITRQAENAQVDWGIKPTIAVTLYPPTSETGPTIGLRESKRSRKTEKTIEVGRLYTMLIKWAVAGEQLKRAKTRAAERKLRRRLK